MSKLTPDTFSKYCGWQLPADMKQGYILLWEAFVMILLPFPFSSTISHPF